MLQVDMENRASGLSMNDVSVQEVACTAPDKFASAGTGNGGERAED